MPYPILHFALVAPLSRWTWENDEARIKKSSRMPAETRTPSQRKFEDNLAFLKNRIH